MSKTQVTDDMVRLLVLVSRFTRLARGKGESERWIKKLPLLALIARGTRLGVFKGYDLAPMLVEYMGTNRFATLSKEGEDDIADLRELGLLQRLRLATAYHFYVSAYRITPEGMEVVSSADEAHHAAVRRIVECQKCGGDVTIETLEDAPYLFCHECGAREKVAIFDIEEIPYVTEPVIADAWLPPD